MKKSKYGIKIACMLIGISEATKIREGFSSNQWNQVHGPIQADTTMTWLIGLKAQNPQALTDLFYNISDPMYTNNFTAQYIYTCIDFFAFVEIQCMRNI